MAYCRSENQERYKARSYSLIRKMIAERNREIFKGVPKTDQARKNMKGRSGTWKRTEKHNLRMVGKNNPMYGKTGNDNPMANPDSRKKVSESKIGRKRVYREDGTHFYEKRN